MTSGLEHRLLLWLWGRALRRGGVRLPVGDQRIVAGPEHLEVK